MRSFQIVAFALSTLALLANAQSAGIYQNNNRNIYDMKIY